MRLKLDQLQKVVKRTIEEEKAAEALKSEISRVFGTTVITEGKLEAVVAAANDRLDVIERTGHSRLAFKPAVAVAFLDHREDEIRKFASRVCPESFLSRMTNDRSPEVRAAVASRSPLALVKEMVRRFPNDDGLITVFRQKRRLTEAGIAQPKVEPMGHDPVEDKKRLGAVAKTQEGPELSENWYNQHALRFLHDYGRNIEYAWEELAVKQFCQNVRVTSGVEIDEAKLMKNIKDLIKEREDIALERDALKETLDWLAAQDEIESLTESAMPLFTEEVDVVKDLLNGGFSGEQFLEQASKIFHIRESMLPLGIRKYRLGEGNARQTMIPAVGRLPHNFGFRASDERALDMFCESWTCRQQLAGEPLRLEWTNHPSDVNMIGFTCILK